MDVTAQTNGSQANSTVGALRGLRTLKLVKVRNKPVYNKQLAATKSNFFLIDGIFKDINAKLEIRKAKTKTWQIYLKMFINFLSLALNLVSILIFLLQDAFEKESTREMLDDIDFTLSFYFLCEVAVLLSKEGAAFFGKSTNVVDVFAVGIAFLTRFLSVDYNLSFLRVVRVFKVIRIFRLFKYLEAIKMEKDEFDESTYIYSKTTIRKLKLGIHFFVAVFFAIGVLDLLSQRDEKSMNMVLNNVDRLYFIMSLAFITGSPQIQPGRGLTRIFLSAGFCLWVYFFLKSWLALTWSAIAEIKKNKFFNFENHLVVFGYFNERSLINLLEELYDKEDFSKAPKCVILIFKSNFENLQFLKAHYLYNKKFFIFEVHNLNFDTLKLVNIAKVNAIFSANFNPFSHFNFIDNTFNLLVKSILTNDQVKDKPVFSLYKSQIYKDQLENHFSCTQDSLRIDLLAQAISNPHLPFVLTSICFERKGAHTVVVVKLPDRLGASTAGAVARELLRVSLRDNEKRPPLMIGLIKVDTQDRIEKLVFGVDKTICTNSLGIFLASDEQSVAALLLRVRSAPSIEKSTNPLDNTLRDILVRPQPCDSELNIIRASKMMPSERIGSLEVLKLHLKNHVVVLGISCDLEYLVGKIREYLPRSIVVFVDDNVSQHKKALLRQLYSLRSVFVVDFDMLNCVCLEKFFYFKQASKIIVSFPTIPEKNEAYMLVSKFVEVKWAHKAIICCEKEFANNCLRTTVSHEKKLSNPSFKEGRLVYSSLFERIFSMAYKKTLETTCIIELIKTQKGGSNPKLSFHTAAVPNEFIGRPYQFLRVSAAENASGIIPLGVYFKYPNGKQEFLINPPCKEILTPNSTFLFLHSCKSDRSNSTRTLEIFKNIGKNMQKSKDKPLFAGNIVKEIEKLKSFAKIKRLITLLKEKHSLVPTFQ